MSVKWRNKAVKCKTESLSVGNKEVESKYTHTHKQIQIQNVMDITCHRRHQSHHHYNHYPSSTRRIHFLPPSMWTKKNKKQKKRKKNKYTPNSWLCCICYFTAILVWIFSSFLFVSFIFFPRSQFSLYLSLFSFNLFFFGSSHFSFRLP